MQGRLSTTKVDRLGERLRKGPVSDDDLRLLEAHRRTFGNAYETVVGEISNTLGMNPTGRPSKSTSSIVEKLRRETIRLSQIQDIAGCRLVVPDIQTQDRTVASLSACFPNATVVDRRINPTWGYRAVHVIIAMEGRLVEVQVRTTLQHLWAETSEKLSDAVGVDLKYGGGDPKLRDLLLERSTFVSRMEEFEERARTLGAALTGEAKELLEELVRDTAESLNDLKRMVEEIKTRGNV